VEAEKAFHDSASGTLDKLLTQVGRPSTAGSPPRGPATLQGPALEVLSFLNSFFSFSFSLAPSGHDVMVASHALLLSSGKPHLNIASELCAARCWCHSWSAWDCALLRCAVGIHKCC